MEQKKMTEQEANEMLADMIMKAYPMPRADPDKRMDLSRLYMLNIKHPVIEQRYMDFKFKNGIPQSCAMSDRERLCFELSMLERNVKNAIYKLCKDRLEMRGGDAPEPEMDEG